MARIKVADLPANYEIRQTELVKVLGGFRAAIYRGEISLPALVSQNARLRY